MGGGERFSGVHISWGIGVRTVERDDHVARAVGLGDVSDVLGDLLFAAEELLAKLGGQGGDALLVDLLEGALGGGGNDGAHERHGDDDGECESDQQARAKGHGAVPESQTLSKRQSPRCVIGDDADTRTRLAAP